MRGTVARVLVLGCLFVATARAEQTKPEQECAALIKNLASDKFEEREAAKKSLIELGDRAVESLKEAANSTDPETKTKATEILLAIKEAKEPLVKPARETYEASLAAFQRGLKDIESVNTWSLRWANAFQGDAAEHAAALEAHLARMKELADSAARMEGAGQLTKGDVSAAKYYLKQAEIMVKQAKAELKKP